MSSSFRGIVVKADPFGEYNTLADVKIEQGMCLKDVKIDPSTFVSLRTTSDVDQSRPSQSLLDLILLELMSILS